MGHPQLLWATCSSASQPYSKEFLSYVKSKPTFFQFKTVAPCPVTACPSLSISLISPLEVSEGHNKVSPETSLLQAPVFPHRRGVPTLWSFSWPSSGPPLTGPCLYFAGDPRAGYRTPGRVSPEQSRQGRITSLEVLICCSCFFLCSPRYNSKKYFPGCKDTWKQWDLLNFLADIWPGRFSFKWKSHSVLLLLSLSINKAF